MNKFDHPTDFELSVDENGISVRYRNEREVCQGGPVLGNVYVNGRSVFDNHECGGPALVKGTKVYVPVYIRGFWKSGFKVGEVDVITLQERLLGEKENYIHLSDVRDCVVTFYTNSTQSKKKSIEA